MTVGIGFIGLNLVIGLLANNLGSAVQLMVDRFGLSFVRHRRRLACGGGHCYGFECRYDDHPYRAWRLNIIMLLTNTTQTVDVDIWDYWHFAFTGALVAILTGSEIMGITAAVLNMIIIMVLGDYTAPQVEESLGLPGVSLPHGFTTAYAPYRDLV